MKTCPCPCGCKVTANNLEEKEKYFGWRGRIIQSYCKKCRSPHQGLTFEENINPIFNIILEGTKYDYLKTSYFNSQIPKFDENGKYFTGEMKNKLTKEYLVNKYKKSVEDFLRLLEESEPNIEEEKFVELFEMYNFHISKPEQESFFKFEISGESKKDESQQELKSNQKIYVILKMYQTINESYMKILNAKLQDSFAIIISLVNDNPLDFMINNDKICILDRDLIKCLLKYRIYEIKLSDIHQLISEKGKS